MDISEGGLALSGVPPDWETGTKIQVRVEGGLPRRILADATIVSRRGDAAGVQFVTQNAELAATVAEYVARAGGREP